MQTIAKAWLRPAVLALCLIAGIPAACPAQAQPAWPQRPVKIVIPLPAGTSADAALRIYAERLSQIWGQAVTVDNRPGAEGVIAVAGFVRANDDHSLLFSYGGPITISPVISKDLPYDPVKDLVPITAGTDSVLGLVVNAAVPAASLKGLEAYARAQPGKVNWTAAPGLPQFLMASFQKNQALAMAYVPYKDVGPLLQDISSGRIHAYAAGFGTFRPLMESGAVRLLAMFNRERFAAVPDVPTVAEAGYPELAADGFNGFFGNAGMSAAVRDRIAADVRAIAADPAIQARLAVTAQLARANGPEAFTAMIEAQRRQIVEIVRVTGAVPGQ